MLEDFIQRTCAPAKPAQTQNQLYYGYQCARAKPAQNLARAKTTFSVSLNIRIIRLCARAKPAQTQNQLLWIAMYAG